MRRRSTIGFVGIVATGVASAGCDTPLGSDLARDDSPVQTDAVVYTLTRQSGAWRAYALATYRNTTGAPVSFVRCHPNDTLPLFGVRRTGADSTRPLFRDQFWSCLVAPTGSIGSGAEVTVRVPLGSVDQPDMQPPLQPEWLVGQMRVVLKLCEAPVADGHDCVLLPQARRQSNAFEVRF